jgi:hypothetical protein
MGCIIKTNNNQTKDTIMNTIAATIAALCSLGFSLLTIATLALGMETIVPALLGCMALVSTGYAVAITDF